MEIVRKEVDIYVCSDGFETMEKWRAEVHQKSIDEKAKKKELLNLIKETKWTMGEQFIRFKEDIDYKILNELMCIWFLEINEYVHCNMYSNAEKDIWYMIERRDEVDDDGCVTKTVKLANQKDLIVRCRGLLDFLGQEEQLKLF